MNASLKSREVSLQYYCGSNVNTPPHDDSKIDVGIHKIVYMGCGNRIVFGLRT